MTIPTSGTRGRSYQKRGRPEPVPTIVKGRKLTFLYRHPHGARERCGIGWFTLCNIPWGRVFLPSLPRVGSRYAIRDIKSLC
jgi:hypothetical protein